MTNQIFIITFTIFGTWRRGWQFFCDADGNIDTTRYSQEFIDIYNECRTGVCDECIVGAGVIRNVSPDQYTPDQFIRPA